MKDRQVCGGGWNHDRIGQAIDSPRETHNVIDRRSATDGSGEPATAYVHSDGGYVILNDASGDIVQVSDLTRPCRAPWD